jgi:plasmid maintenance system antidote protein VapI
MNKLKVIIKARALLTILARRNMSQNGLARGASLQSGHVSQLISGKRNVSPATRQRLLAALPGVEFDDVFSIRERR